MIDIPLLFIYPVPAQNELNIEMVKEHDEQYLLRVVAMDGKVVFNEVILVANDEKISLNCSNWNPGNYFVILYDKDGNKVQINEVVIQR